MNELCGEFSGGFHRKERSERSDSERLLPSVGLFVLFCGEVIWWRLRSAALFRGFPCLRRAALLLVTAFGLAVANAQSPPVITEITGPTKGLKLDGTSAYLSLPSSALNNLAEGTIEASVFLNQNNDETITGSNFSATPANNIVFFGGVGAQVTAVHRLSAVDVVAPDIHRDHVSVFHACLCCQLEPHPAAGPLFFTGGRISSHVSRASVIRWRCRQYLTEPFQGARDGQRRRALGHERTRA